MNYWLPPVNDNEIQIIKSIKFTKFSNSAMVHIFIKESTTKCKAIRKYNNGTRTAESFKNISVRFPMKYYKIYSIKRTEEIVNQLLSDDVGAFNLIIDTLLEHE